METYRTGFVESMDDANQCGIIYCQKISNFIPFRYADVISPLKPGDAVTFKHYQLWTHQCARDIFLDARPLCDVFKVDFRLKNYFKINGLGIPGELKSCRKD